MKIIIRLTILMMLFAITIIAQSQEPAPSTLETSTNPKKHSRKSDNDTNGYNRGTEQSPIFVKELRTEPTTTERDAEAKDRNQKASYERWTVISTADIAIFTTILAVITGFLAYFTFKLWSATKTLLESSEKTTRIHERAYVHEIGNFANNFDVFWSIVINYGKTPAFIEDICITICSADKLPKIPDYKDREFYGVHLAPNRTNTTPLENKTRKGINNPIVYGRVWYKDIFDDKHSSGFIYSINDGGGTVAIKAPAEFTACD